jgi:Pectate lyase superfamily protein
MNQLFAVLLLSQSMVITAFGHTQGPAVSAGAAPPARTLVSAYLRAEGGANTLATGSTLLIIAYGIYSDGSVGTLPDSQGNAVTAWNTTNHLVARVSSRGYAWGVSAGTIHVEAMIGTLVASPWQLTVSKPPTISCSATPPIVTLGGSVAIVAAANSPEGRPLTYSWSASSGAISGTGNSATLNTSSASAGSITVNCTVADNQGLTASATIAVTVNAAGTSPLQPPQCVAAVIKQPAPIVSLPITLVLPTATTINVLLNGAAGDGQTNDSPALQSVVNNNPNAVIYFPIGDYVLDNPSPNQPGLLFSGFQGTAIMANGARFLCDTATTSAGHCIRIINSTGASFDNFRVGYTQEQNLPLARTSAISSGILVENSSALNFGNTTIEASTGSGIWVTDSTGISFLSGTSVSNTTADGLHFENVGNATVVGYTGRNTGDDSLAATNIAPTNPNCGLKASNIQIYQSHSRGIAVAGACGSSFSNFFIENTSNSGLGVVQDQTIQSRIPVNSTFSDGTVVNAGRYPGIPGSKDCIDIAESSTTTVSNVECSTPMIDGVFIFGGADQVTVSGVTVDAPANVGLQAVGSTNVSLANTVSRNSANAGYAIQSLQGGSMAGADTCSSGVYGFYHSAAIHFTESNLMSYDSAENSSMHRVWWAENNSEAVSVNGFSILDDQAHHAPDVVGGFGDASGSIVVDGITQNLLDTTLSMQLP